MMKLRLDDNGPTGVQTVYNPRTGIAKVIQPVTGLSGRKERKARRAARQAAKTAKKQAKLDRKVARQQAKTARKVARQDRRTDRVQQKTERKAVKRAVKTARKEKRLIRVQGRQNIIRARQEGREEAIRARNEQRIASIMNPEFSPEYEDQLPNDLYQETPGGEYMTSPDMFYPEPEYVDTGYEEITDPEDLVYGEDPYYEFDEYSEELSAPFLPAIIGGIKNLVGKVKAKAQAAKATRVGGIVNNTLQLQRQNAQLKLQNNMLQREIKSLNTRVYVASGISAVAGAVGGVLIARKRK